MRAWLALKRHWIKQLFNWFSLPMSRWHSQSSYSSTAKSYKYSMWSLHGSVLPGLMSFPKVWMLHVSFTPSFLAPRLALLMVLMASWALQNQISIGIDCCCCIVWTCLCMHVNVVQQQVAFCSHLGVCVLYCCKWVFFTQHSKCPHSSVWLCSGLTEAMLTLCEIHSLGLWAGLWQRQAVRVHPSETNCLHLGPTWLSLTWAGLFQPLCWISAYKDPDFNQTRQGFFNWGLSLLANPITSTRF